MSFFGISGMYFSGESLGEHRIVLAEDSNLFASMVSKRLKELFDIDVIVCRDYEDLQFAVENASFAPSLAISNINLPGAENGEALTYLIEMSVPTIVFTGSFQESTREAILAKDIVDYVIKDSVFAVDMLAESVCRFLTNQQHHVLIVDDSATARAVLTTQLKRYNFRTSSAESGSAALEILKSNPDIALVITDYNMPDIDGFELTRRIRAAHGPHQLRIIGVSSSTDRLLSARFLKAGGNDFIVRPFVNEEFYCRVNQNLDTLTKVRTLNARTKIPA
ncbi:MULTISPECIES: response regulator [Sinorhizobium]|jgi:PleD family two-component response regulator|uniref:response regulator n=1 Tax=Sinorhizobium TaxID=28105 RepID=UPI0003605744|nr:MULTISPECIES: response regulator [Sinorhizobium]PND22196.1 response regulator [Ensifer sp. MMN_5]PND29123.1 response regulator [Sinorhizobium sp. M4_45]WEJ09028.1 response regulator [Sinorhizobium sp. M103]WEJ16433.1 response regulator [Sinorhizobium sp. K101]WEJ35987.1 response regulator [Sinorhizobium sp. C101]